MFPNHDPHRLGTLITSALNRLTKRSIRYWPSEDDYCLSFDEGERVRDRLAELEIANDLVDSEIQATLLRHLKDKGEVEHVTELVRMSISHFFMERGEIFAGALANNQLSIIGVEDLRRSVEYVIDQLGKNRRGKERGEVVRVILSSVRDLFAEPSRSVQSHLRTKADAYTLFSFLGRTPDIQRAISKMFSHGTIWLDTTIVLPLLAEELILDGHRRFSNMLKAATAAGLELRVTSGVIEEVERHINLSITYLNMPHSEWSGNIPFLADAYMRSGRNIMAFSDWIEQFEGKERPEDDLAEYFEEFFEIKREDLEADEMKASRELRFAVHEAWQLAHSGP